MILCLPFSLRDHQLARKLAKWIVTLGGDFKADTLMLVQDSRCTDDHQILNTLGPLFGKAIQVLYPDDAINAWPQSANRMLTRALKENEFGPNPEPLFWMEPDCVPMKKGWWADLKHEFVEVAWKQHKKVFMGAKVDVPDVVLHMSGIGFYPAQISQHAYETTMAFDEAWDCAAAHQIVPKAWFSQKIVHNWRHEAFKSQAELDNLRQNHPEMVLFHSDKSGTLIDFLEAEASVSKLGPRAGVEGTEVKEANALKERAEPSQNFSQSADTARPAPEDDRNHGLSVLPAQSTAKTLSAQAGAVDLFIKTFPADYPWLDYCMESIAKFAKGFRTVVVVSDDRYPASDIACPPVGEAEVSVKTVSPQPDGYLWQQVIKLDADKYTDAEWIVYMDSDTIFKRPITAQQAIELPWMMTPYSDKMSNEKVWHWVTERFLKQPVEFEFMRRFPFVTPRWLLKELRDFCYGRHGVGLDQYILNCPTRNFSEFNALGAYAYYYHRDKFIWVNTETIPPEKWPILYVNQEWSKGGLTEQIRKEYEEILGGGSSAIGEDAKLETQQKDEASPISPHVRLVELAKEVAPAGSNSAEDELETPYPGIHQTKKGWWVIDGDQRIGKWVEDEGRLDHDQWLLERILPLVKHDDTVIEVGAYIGDHTHAFLDVGAKVYAFEPNPIAAECLRRNCSEAAIYEVAAWNESTSLELTAPPDNPGGAWLAESFKNGGVDAQALDSMLPGADLMMLDAEGSELFALRGAEKLITKYHPVLVIEINRAALGRYGYRAADVFFWLKEHGYEWKPIQEHLVADPPQYDVIAKYTPQSEIEAEVSKRPRGRPRVGPKAEAKPPAKWDGDRVEQLVTELAACCNSPTNKGRVRKALVSVQIFPSKVLGWLKN